jgi:ABC-2 type transport system ATP-binding protein
MGFDHRRDEVALKQCAAYVGPDLNFQIWVTVAKAVRFVRGFYPGWDDAYCAELMKSLQLNSGDIIRTLSFGGRTKLSLLLALARRPQVLILDEPTTGLDAVSKQQVFSELLKVVEDGQHTVLISSHGLTDIERFADHIGMIKEGKLLFEGQTDTIVERYRFVDFFMDKEIPIDNRQGLRILKHCDNRYHALLDEESFARDWLQKNGVRDLTATRLTLEDLFVALAK